MLPHSKLDGAPFPKAGVLARRWQRFEHGYRAWLDSPPGRFALWQAQAAVESAEGRGESGTGADDD